MQISFIFGVKWCDLKFHMIIVWLRFFLFPKASQAKAYTQSTL